MLAIDGSSPIPVLEDLARDPGFSGTVICSIIPMFLGEADENGRARKWVRKYRHQTVSSRLEARLAALLRQHFVFRYSGLLPDELWSDLMQDEPPRPPYAPLRPDRYRPANFSGADIERIRAGRIEREKELHARADPLSRRRFLDKAARLDRMVAEIESRGGRVVFVRYPSTGPVRRMEGETWPRDRYWDVLAHRTSAATIHFEDYPSLSGFNCPDGSHLDVADAERFTRELAKILAAKGLVETSGQQRKSQNSNLK